jgi:hypothetical protein
MKSVLLAFLVASLLGTIALALLLRAAVQKGIRRYVGVRSASLGWWLGELLRKGADRSALFIQDRDRTRSIQIEKYVEGAAAELVWIFPRTGWSLPYSDRFLAEVRASGWEASAGSARRRRHESLEVRMGHEVQRVRKLILRVLTDVYQVPPLECRVVLLNVPDATEPGVDASLPAEWRRR